MAWCWSQAQQARVSPLHLASMIDYLNREENGHILTIEDPIEYVHQHKNCIVNQREVGSDSKTFHAALKHALQTRSGLYLWWVSYEILETIEMALTAAETGHLVFATLHTNSAVQSIRQSIERISTAPATADSATPGHHASVQW
jgi:twitching motility protein PilT